MMKAMKITSRKLLSLVMTIVLLAGLVVPFTVNAENPPADPFYYYNSDGTPNYIVNGDDWSSSIGTNGSIGYGAGNRLNFNKNHPVPANAEALVFFFDLTGDGIEKTANGEYLNKLAVAMGVLDADDTLLYGRITSSSGVGSNYIKRQMLYHWHGDYHNDVVAGRDNTMSYGGDYPTNQSSFPSNGYGYVIIRPEDIIDIGGVAESIAEVAYMRFSTISANSKMDVLNGYTLKLMNPGYLMDVDAFVRRYEFSQEDYTDGPLPELGDITLALDEQTDTAAQLSWNAFSGAAKYQVNLYTAGGSYTFASEKQTGNLSAVLASLAPATPYAVQVLALDAGGTAVAASNKVEFTTEYPGYFYNKDGSLNYIVTGDDLSLPIAAKGSIGTNKKLNITQNGAIPADAEALVFFFDLTGEGMDKTANGEFNNMLSTGVCVMGTDDTPLYGRPGASSSTRVTTSGYLQRQMLYHWHGDYKNESFTGTPRMSYGGDNPTSQASFPANGSGYVIIRADDIVDDGGVATSIADAGYIRLTNGATSTKMDYLEGHTLELSNPGYLMDVDAFVKGYDFSIQGEYKNGPLEEEDGLDAEVTGTAGGTVSLSWSSIGGADQYMINLYTEAGAYVSSVYTSETSGKVMKPDSSAYKVQVLALDDEYAVLSASNILSLALPNSGSLTAMGGSIRTDSAVSFAIRFGAELIYDIDNSDKTMTVDGQTKVIKSFGFIMAANQYLGLTQDAGLDAGDLADAMAALTVAAPAQDSKIKNIPAEKFADFSSIDGDNTILYAAVITGLNEANKDFWFVARPYVEFNDGTILYGEVKSRSWNWVKSAL